MGSQRLGHDWATKHSTAQLPSIELDTQEVLNIHLFDVAVWSSTKFYRFLKSLLYNSVEFLCKGCPLFCLVVYSNASKRELPWWSSG